MNIINNSNSRLYKNQIIEFVEEIIKSANLECENVTIFCISKTPDGQDIIDLTIDEKTYQIVNWNQTAYGAKQNIDYTLCITTPTPKGTRQDEIKSGTSTIKLK